MDDTYINKNFLIRYYADSSNTHANTLITPRRMRELLGEQLYTTTLQKAIRSREQERDFRFRRGIRFTFRAK